MWLLGVAGFFALLSPVALQAAEKITTTQHDTFIGVGVGRSYGIAGIRFDLEIEHPSFRVSTNVGIGGSNIGLRYRECRRTMLNCFSGIYYVGSCPRLLANDETDLDTCASFGVEWERVLTPQWSMELGVHAIHFFEDVADSEPYPNEYGSLSWGIMRKF